MSSDNRRASGKEMAMIPSSFFPFSYSIAPAAPLNRFREKLSCQGNTRDPGGFPITRPTDVHKSLIDCLRELHLPTIRRDYESAAQRARQESLSYESYLLDLAEQECESRRSSRVERLLRGSRVFMEKSLSTLDLKRLPPKAAQQVRSLLEGGFTRRH